MSQYNHCIVTQWDGRFGWVALYCTTRIVLQEVWLGAGGERRARRAGGACRSAARGTQVEARGDAGRAGARHRRLVGHRDTAGGPGHDTARLAHDTAARAQPYAAWACLCAQAGCAAGPAGCALGALSLFLTRFDLVLFLSQFLDTVPEPGS